MAKKPQNDFHLILHKKPDLENPIKVTFFPVWFFLLTWRIRFVFCPTRPKTVEKNFKRGKRHKIAPFYGKKCINFLVLLAEI